MRRFVIIGAVLLLPFAKMALADAPSAPALRIPPIAKAPVIDGTMAPGEWEGAFAGCGMRVNRWGGSAILDRVPSRYWITYDEERIYIASQIALPPWGSTAGKKRRIEWDVTSDDGLELWIDPARPGMARMDRTFYQIIANAYDTKCSLAHNKREVGWRQFNGESIFKSTCKDGWWTAEFSVAASELNQARIMNGNTWGFHFGRHLGYDNITYNNQPVSGAGGYSGWPGLWDWRDPTSYAQVTLDAKAPVVQLQDIGQPYEGKPGLQYSLYNPTTAPIQLSVKMRVEDTAAADKKKEQIRDVTLGPEERKSVQWSVDWPLEEKGISRLSTEVTSSDGKTSYFATHFAFGKEYKGEKVWSEPPAKKQEVVWKPCFYPGFSRLRCLADVSGLADAASIKRGNVVVRDPGGQEIGRGALENFVDGETETAVQLPQNLVEGVYTVDLTLSDGTMTVGQPMSKTFTRKKFPFENNTIGVTDKLLSPWTPMKVNPAKSSVACWNREFVVGKDGFFKQIKSGKWELLKQPIQLTAKSGGKELKWRAQGVKFGNASGSAVDFTAASECEKVKATVAVHSEFDGMFQYSLTLSPRGDGQVDGLDLVVPLSEENAWLLHATSDGTRTNASMFTPGGRGRIWDSAQVLQWRLTGTFIPYLWLGSDQAGVCWWADSEKGWVRPADKKTPAVEVRREKGEVQMVFHLIGRPFKLTEPRTMVFAFNATPVRPRPSWARSWTNLSGKGDGFLKGPHLRVDGSASWVTFGQDALPDRPYNYGSIRPINDEADQWLKKYAAQRHADGYTLVPYTDIYMRAVDRGDEVKHYASEWDRGNIPHPQEETQNWPSHGAVGLTNMTRSRVDYDLWCLKHGAELGVDGFYFDEVMAVGQINPSSNLGFRDEADNWEAECSLFALRAYFKRLYAMLQEMGHPEPFIMPHDSSTVYAGPFAFATIPMELEMTSPDVDPQRGQVFGLGEGYAMCDIMAWNYGLVGSGMVCPAPYTAYAAGDYRLARTFVGSLLLFDCRAIFGIPRTVGDRFDYALGQFGMDAPGVEYVPYWRAGDLQMVDPASTIRVSLFRNQGKALLVMYNDSPKPVTVHWQAKTKFGLNGRFTIPEKDEPDHKAAEGVSQEEHGVLKVELRPYDYRLVIVPTKGKWGAQDQWGPVDPRLFERNVKVAPKSP